MSTLPPVDPPHDPAEDAYVDRLRAADPAAGLDTDLTGLRAAVASRAALAGVPSVVPDELAARRSRRFGRPARVAAAAAAVLVVGSGGYALGVGTSPTSVQGAAPVISLGGPGGARVSAAGGSAEGPVTPAPEALAGGKGLSQLDVGFGGWWGRTVFTSTGLSTTGGSAEAWALDPSSTFSEATATAAATALGLAGAPALVGGAWQVGPNDGTGPTLTLSPDGQGSLSFYDPTVDPWRCVATDAPTVVPDASAAPDRAIAPGEPQCSEADLGPAPGSDAAAARLREVLRALSIDDSTYEMVPEDYGDTMWSYVTAYQVVDGQRTGLTWSAAMTGAGLSSLYGSTAPLVSLGRYDVVSPAEAVTRLGDPRFGASGGYPLAADVAGGMAESSGSSTGTGAIAPAPEPTLPPVPRPGQAFSWPVQTVEITAARLGVAQTWQGDGSVVLVPTYALTGADGSTWSVIAVSDAALDFSTVG